VMDRRRLHRKAYWVSAAFRFLHHASMAIKPTTGSHTIKVEAIGNGCGAGSANSKTFSVNPLTISLALAGDSARLVSEKRHRGRPEKIENH
jgi:hypothetical protein